MGDSNDNDCTLLSHGGPAGTAMMAEGDKGDNDAVSENARRVGRLFCAGNNPEKQIKN